MRSYRGLWLWLGGLFLTLFFFLAAVAIAYVANGTHYSLFLNGWMLGAFVCFVAAYACFLASSMSMPPDLPPGGAASGHLVYEVPGYYLDKIAEPVSMRLELRDHRSGHRMTVPTEIGGHGKSRMIPSSGGAELLGPEYENQADQQGDARRASA